ncbi:MAG: helix-turn-helix domain-containing protein [Verrucomicrobia bacterium]|nr:helix-turn-helix domain-containing protein [Verrucomicrobiota bacterium]MBU4291058.1 helix-turn-helix domain-containing protein [Verrucomicrobiota bacterium]MBU4428398.1 helix-turn-helix domain-containing protein [Verrucomicrobiota bacterium]MBU4498349.1 helix-turn-helix domain-containing protein [Verrucomicrobiota bacterium]MCG2679454.1 helix-turn-helix domain-containing protein [Kiritimatiellia bacterium]
MIRASPNTDQLDIAQRLHHLRQRCHLSMRQLAAKADVAASYISGVEAGRISPTIATLRKMLNALGADIGDFFSKQKATTTGHVFRRETMRTISDRKRFYTMILPSRPDIRLLMLDEECKPGEHPQYETMPGDFAGYVVQGEILLEIKGRKPVNLRSGDAFYAPARTKVRGRALRREPARLITVQMLPSESG